MTDIVPMKSVEAVLYGVLKIAWLDGYEAVVDLRPIIGEGEIFALLRGTPEHFNSVELAEFGHSIFWRDDEGDGVDFGSDSLRPEPAASPARHSQPG